MRALIWLTTLVVILLVFIVPAILAMPIDSVPFADQPGYSVDDKVSIYRARSVSQEFTSQENNLTAVKISLGNPNLKNKKDIILALFDSAGNPIRQSTINGQNLEDGDFVRFDFAPIPDSRGKKFLFTIASPDAGPEEVVNAYYSRTAPGWMGRLQYEDKVIGNAALPFVTFHKVASKSLLIRDVYRRWIDRVF